MVTLLQEKLRRVANNLPQKDKIILNEFDVQTLADSHSKILLNMAIKDRSAIEAVVVTRGNLPMDKFKHYFDTVNLSKQYLEGYAESVFGMRVFMVHSFEGWAHVNAGAVMVIFPLGKAALKATEKLYKQR